MYIDTLYTNAHDEKGMAPHTLVVLVKMICWSSSETNTLKCVQMKNIIKLFNTLFFS